MWIAKVLQVPVEDLSEGVEVPHPVRAARQHFEEFTARVLAAESAREDALQETVGLRDELSALRKEGEASQARGLEPSTSPRG